MPRVHTQKAGEDYPAIGVVKGETYYWWKFRYGGKHKSKTYPRASQLTQSEFLQQVYEINDEISNLEFNEDLQSNRDDIVDRLNELKDEQEEKRSNMPEQLQEVGSGEILQNRMDSLDEMISELESIDLELLPEDNSLEDSREALMEELHNVCHNGE